MGVFLGLGLLVCGLVCVDLIMDLVIWGLMVWGLGLWRCLCSLFWVVLVGVGCLFRGYCLLVLLLWVYVGVCVVVVLCGWYLMFLFDVAIMCFMLMFGVLCLHYMLFVCWVLCYYCLLLLVGVCGCSV